MSENCLQKQEDKQVIPLDDYIEEEIFLNGEIIEIYEISKNLIILIIESSRKNMYLYLLV